MHGDDHFCLTHCWRGVGGLSPAAWGLSLVAGAGPCLVTFAVLKGSVRGALLNVVVQSCSGFQQGPVCPLALPFCLVLRMTVGFSSWKVGYVSNPSE